MAATIKKALYHNAKLEAKEFEVLAENEDGTVDIGLGKTVAVAKAPLAKDGVPKHGHVILLATSLETEPAAEDAGGPGLLAKTKAQLMECVEKFNATAKAEAKIVLVGNASKQAVADALTAAGYKE